MEKNTEQLHEEEDKKQKGNTLIFLLLKEDGMKQKSELLKIDLN